MRYDLPTFRGDLFGALTSTVVALPVALALGVASGMGAVAGLHGASAPRHGRRPEDRQHLLTLGLTVFVDLVTAVAVGLIAAGMAHARRLERLELDSVVSVPLLDRTFFTEEQGPPAADRYSVRVGLVALKGTLTVASSSKLVAVIGGDIKDHEVVIFDFSEAVHLDDSAAMVMRRLSEVASAARTEVVVCGLSGSVARTLRTLDILRGIAQDRLTGTLDEARAVASELLNERPAAG